MKSRSHTSKQVHHFRALWQAFLLALLLVVGPVEAAVRATLDRGTVYAGDTFTLTIESDGLQSGLQPDLTPLEKNFDVLGTSTSTQVRIINGRRSDKTRWQVQLQPRHTGQLRIPPLSVGGQQTAPLQLKISKAPQQATTQAGQHVFVEAEINSAGKQTYVQQQIPYTVRLYYDGRLQEGELSAPKLENAIIEQLGEDKSYTAERNGQQYNVVERQYVISPEKSGSLRIAPATFTGSIIVPQPRKQSRRRSRLMEEFLGNSPFANDPFFRNSLLNDSFLSNSPFGGSTKPITARSRSINMNIKPRPVTVGRNWLPAEAVTLDDSWTQKPPRFRVGEPVSRTITIETKGLSGSQIPELAIATPANTRLYPETPKQESRTDGKTIYGVRTQTLTYIPGTQGTLNVPALTIDWWDTRRNKAASTILPALQFKVLPAAGTGNEVKAAPRSPAAQQSPAASPANKATQANKESGLPETIFATIKTNESWLFTGGGLLLILVLLGLMVRRTKQRRQVSAPGTVKQTQQPTQQIRPNQKSALRALQKACTANDRHAAVAALLSLGHAHWPDAPPRSLNALAARIENGQTQLGELDRSLYAADTSNWNGAALWDEFRHGLQEKKMTRINQDDGLNPLYPQHH